MVWGPGSPVDGDVFLSLSNRRRRRVLEVVRHRDDPVLVDTLATFLAGEEGAETPDDGASAEARGIRAGLVHDHLPRLETAGLLRWDRDDGLVGTTDHDALSDPSLERVLEEPCGDWDPVLEALAHDRRRRVLAVLRDHGGVMDRRELAMEVLGRESGTDGDSPASNRGGHDDGTESGGLSVRSDSVRHAERGNGAVLSLHHVHLPKLERVGLVAYDATDGTVSYQGDTTLVDELLDVHGDRSRSPSSV